MESERWFRVSKAREIEKNMEGGSNYYYAHHGVMGSGSSSSSGMLMPPPSLVNSYADKTSSSSNNQQQQHSFLNSLPFTNINPNQNGSQEYEMCMKTKVMCHPLFPRLLASYVNCQKVGAPAEVVARLEHAAAASISSAAAVSVEESEPDPELDQFMEAYCEMLTKYHEELTKPFHEAMLGLSKINSQLNSLSITPSYSARTGDLAGQIGSSEEADVNKNCIDPRAEDWDIRAKLLKKYSGCLGSLSQEIKKKKKNVKLPKEARVQLQEWWKRNYTWPYPSEPQKLALATSTGLTVKQINNWFINQRKRHWKPTSEGMQLAMVDHPQFFYNYMDHMICNPSPMDSTSTPFF